MSKSVSPARIKLPSQICCKDATSLGQAKVSLDDGIFSSSVTHDGNFIMYVQFFFGGFLLIYSDNTPKTRCPRRDLHSISNLS